MNSITLFLFIYCVSTLEKSDIAGSIHEQARFYRNRLNSVGFKVEDAARDETSTYLNNRVSFLDSSHVIIEKRKIRGNIEESKARLEIINNQYMFGLNRLPDSSHVIVYVHWGSDLKLFDRHEVLQRSLFAPLAISGLPIEELPVKKVGMAKDNFLVTFPGNSNSHFSMAECQFDSKSRLIQSTVYPAVAADNPVVRRSVEIRYSSDGWPCEVVAHSFMSNGAKRLDYHNLISQVNRVNLSPQDFRLGAFGFKEPFGSQQPPTAWWLYALAAAGAAFLLGLLLTIWQRRLQARSAA